MAVQGGGTWGGSGSQSLEREREALKVYEQRRRVKAQEPHLQESWTMETNGDRFDYCFNFLNYPAFISPFNLLKGEHLSHSFILLSWDPG